MRVFLVNLRADSGRLAAADRQLRALGVPYERFEAVDGRALDARVRARAFSRFRWWCANGRAAMAGEIGCALSHQGLYRRMLAEGWPSMCVMEDDVALASGFAQALARVEAWLDPAQAQVVLFSNHTEERAQQPCILPSQGDMYAECYALTAPAAAALLRANVPIRTPCDHWARWVHRGFIRLYHAFPTTASQNTAAFATHMTESATLNYGNRSPLGRVWFKVQRLIGWPLDRLLP